MAATAASSPVLSNNGSETTTGAAAVTSTPATPTSLPGVKSPALPSLVMPRPETNKSTRGSNKPKCGTCGNVARSRCPFSCCKSCCSKAQNPCHIHVLKPNATLADRGASGSPAPPEQQPSEVAPPGPPAKVTSTRQLSNNIAQYNNGHPQRSRKPLTRKEALVINEWRFAKLKEYKESNIEAENEAFDRYMQNIGLLEEVFDVSSDRPQEEDTLLSNLPTTSGDKTEMVSETKAKLRSNPVRIDAFRKRIRQTVDEGLRNLQFHEANDGSGNLDDEGELTPKGVKNWWGGKTSALTELNDKLNRVRGEEDLKLCIQTRSKIKGQGKSPSQKKIESIDMLTERTIPNDLGIARKSESSLLKPIRATEIDQDALNGVEFYFSSLEDIEDL